MSAGTGRRGERAGQRRCAVRLAAAGTHPLAAAGRLRLGHACGSLLPVTPLAPRAATRFSGWRIVVLSSIAFGLSGPGQTAGVSVFVDPMMATLELSRSHLSTASLVGTLGGAVAMPRVGRLIDERGARVAMAVVGGAFGIPGSTTDAG